MTEYNDNINGAPFLDTDALIHVSDLPNEIEQIYDIRYDELVDKSKRIDLIRWLKQKCEYSDNLFHDPGYSSRYKSMFNLTDVDNIIYYDNDIDHELNIGYVDYGFKKDKDPDDLCLEQFIDYVPSKYGEINESIKSVIIGASRDEASDIITKMSRENMLILPGSNHSNANYLYKLITLECMDLNNMDEKPYYAPYVNPDPKVPFKSNVKGLGAFIDKEDFYYFVKVQSKNDKSAKNKRC